MHVRLQMGSCNKILPPKRVNLICDGRKTNTESEMVEVLNDYFAFSFIVEDTFEIQETTPAQPNLIPLRDCDFTEDTVTKTIDKIKVNKTLGPGCIAPRVLKEAKY